MVGRVAASGCKQTLWKFYLLVVAAVLQSFPKSADTNSSSNVRLRHEKYLEILGNANLKKFKLPALAVQACN